MIFLFDTSAFLIHHRQEAGWEKIQEIFEDEETTVIGASLSVAEFARRLLELGATEAEARATVKEYTLLLEEIVPIDETIALRAFEIGCRSPTRLPLVDACIAAAAHERKARLVHRDGHMANIPKDLVEQLNLAP